MDSSRPVRGRMRGMSEGPDAIAESLRSPRIPLQTIVSMLPQLIKGKEVVLHNKEEFEMYRRSLQDRYAPSDRNLLDIGVELQGLTLLSQRCGYALVDDSIVADFFALGRPFPVLSSLDLLRSLKLSLPVKGITLGKSGSIGRLPKLFSIIHSSQEPSNLMAPSSLLPNPGRSV